MTDLIVHTAKPLPLPEPRERIEIAPATMADVDWIDALQKRHRNQGGWHPRGTREGKIGLGQIIVARDAGGARVGYCMASDRYMKREDVGIVYQLNIEAGHQ